MWTQNIEINTLIPSGMMKQFLGKRVSDKMNLLLAKNPFPVSPQKTVFFFFQTPLQTKAINCLFKCLQTSISQLQLEPGTSTGTYKGADQKVKQMLWIPDITFLWNQDPAKFLHDKKLIYKWLFYPLCNEYGFTCGRVSTVGWHVRPTEIQTF